MLKKENYNIIFTDIYFLLNILKFTIKVAFQKISDYIAIFINQEDKNTDDSSLPLCVLLFHFLFSLTDIFVKVPLYFSTPI